VVGCSSTLLASSALGLSLPGRRAASRCGNGGTPSPEPTLSSPSLAVQGGGTPSSSFTLFFISLWWQRTPCCFSHFFPSSAFPWFFLLICCLHSVQMDGAALGSAPPGRRGSLPGRPSGCCTVGPSSASGLQMDAAVRPTGRPGRGCPDASVSPASLEVNDLRPSPHSLWMVQGVCAFISIMSVL
jgi:hypothetical protein